MMEFAKWLIVANAIGSIVVAVVLVSVSAYFTVRWFSRHNDASNTSHPGAERPNT